MTKVKNTLNTIQSILNDVYKRDGSGDGVLRVTLGEVVDLTVTGDLTVQGALNFGDASTDILTITGYIRGSASGLTYVAVGSGTTSHAMASTNDLFVKGQFEVDGTTFFDGQVNFFSTTILGNVVALALGTASAGGTYLQHVTASTQVCLSMGSLGGRNFVITEQGNFSKNHDHALQTNPTLWIHSATNPDTANTQWISVSHNQTEPVIASGLGRIKFSAVGIQKAQGADVASATNITMGTDGNTFELTGTTKVDLIDITGWQNGSEITLVANENVDIDHGTGTSAPNTTILLAGAADFSMTADDTLTLVLCENTASGQAWREKCRTVI